MTQHTHPKITQDDSAPMPRLRSRRIERVSIAGLAISVAVHLVVLLIAVLVRISAGVGADPGGGDPEPVEFAVISESELRDENSLEIPNVEFERIETEVEVDLQLLEETGVRESVSDLADDIAPELELTGASLASIDIQTGSAGAGSGSGASFFGLEASGERFAYIIDRSASMDHSMSTGSTRWEMTRRELLRSVHGLGAGSSFFVTLYSNSSTALFGTREWINATRPNKVSTGAALAQIRPNGATRPAQSFADVLMLEPKPDAVFLMTDGLIQTNDVDDILSTMRRRNIPVHCVLFLERDSIENFDLAYNNLLRIARATRGRFRHVERSVAP